MSTNKTTARIVGVLFIIATVVKVVSVSLIEPLLDEADYLTGLAAADTRVLVSTAADLIVAISVIGIGAMIFPALKRQGEGFALSYLGTRTLEAAVLTIGAISSLLLLALSQKYVESGSSAASSEMESLGSVLLTLRDRSETIGTMIVFGVTALILYPLLYRSRLVPRLLSVWGFIGAVLIVISGLLHLDGGELSTAVTVLLMAPIAINEMVLAAWLIIKGFDADGSPDRSLDAVANRIGG